MGYAERNMLVFTMHNPANPTQVVDLFVQAPIEFERLWNNAVPASLRSVSAPIASIEHLMHMKREAGRDKDLLDLRMLAEIQRRKLSHG